MFSSIPLKNVFIPCFLMTHFSNHNLLGALPEIGHILTAETTSVE